MITISLKTVIQHLIENLSPIEGTIRDDIDRGRLRAYREIIELIDAARKDNSRFSTCGEKDQ